RTLRLVYLSSTVRAPAALSARLIACWQTERSESSLRMALVAKKPTRSPIPAERTFGAGCSMRRYPGILKWRCCHALTFWGSCPLWSGSRLPQTFGSSFTKACDSSDAWKDALRRWMGQEILRLLLTTRRPRYSTVSHGTAQLLHGQKNTCLPLSTIGAREGHYICRVLFTVVGLTHVHKELPISHQPDTLVGSA